VKAECFRHSARRLHHAPSAGSSASTRHKVVERALHVYPVEREAHVKHRHPDVLPARVAGLLRVESCQYRLHRRHASRFIVDDRVDQLGAGSPRGRVA
jgi:hypothetical protein